MAKLFTSETAFEISTRRCDPRRAGQDGARSSATTDRTVDAHRRGHKEIQRSLSHGPAARQTLGQTIYGVLRTHGRKLRGRATAKSMAGKRINEADDPSSA